MFLNQVFLGRLKLGFLCEYSKTLKSRSDDMSLVDINIMCYLSLCNIHRKYKSDRNHFTPRFKR